MVSRSRTGTCFPAFLDDGVDVTTKRGSPDAECLSVVFHIRLFPKVHEGHRRRQSVLAVGGLAAVLAVGGLAAFVLGSTAISVPCGNEGARRRPTLGAAEPPAGGL